MQLLGLLAPLVGLAGLVGFIWLVTVAFKRNVWWGLGVLFLSPIAAIVFAVKYWQETKVPFLVYMGSGVASIFIFVLTFSALGGFEMIEMAGKLNDGTMTEQDATNFIGGQLDRMEDSGMLDEDEKRDLDKMRAMFDEMQEGDDTAAADEPERHLLTTAELGDNARRDDVRPEWAAETAAWARNGTGFGDGDGRIAVRDAGNHLGTPVRVLGKDGLEYRGRIAEARRSSLILERDVSGGLASFEIRHAEIRSMERLSF